MVRIEGRTFRMGSDEFYADETPVHERTVETFEIDLHPVTNEQFAAFVEATGYVTVAERPLDPADFPGVDPAELVPGGLVFTPTPGPVDLRDWRQWWRWGAGASWRHPFGPGSSVDVDRPYAPRRAGELRGCLGVRLVGRQAAAHRGGVRVRRPRRPRRRAVRVGRRRVPGRRAHGEPLAGLVPVPQHGRRRMGRHLARDDVPAERLRTLRRHRQRLGVDDRLLRRRHVVPGAVAVDPGSRENLLAAASAEPGSRIPRRVLKGGSHLCSPDYCLRYRPSARSPQADDTATTHIGFRCAR